jgi:phosphoglycolate phosphatase
VKLVIFDCDGTIVDSQSGIVLSMNHAFETLKLKPPTRAETLAVVGLSLPEAFSALAPNIDYEIRRELAEHYKSAFRDMNRDPAEHEVLFPGAKEVITALAARDGVVLGIATGKSKRGVDRLLVREGWQGHFVTVQTADDHPSKPHPSMIQKAVAETGAAISNTVMIGDTTYDIEMARAAGAGAIGVTWGYHLRSELLDAGAHIIIDDYAALPFAVETVLQQMKQSAT